MKNLNAKFRQEDLEFRILRSGITNNKPWAHLATYVNARAIMDRLDEVAGIANWKDEYEIVDKDVICKLSVKIDGEWITKSDGASFTAVEPFKGGLSDALKRAAVKWGIGRYLYELTDVWAECSLEYKAGWEKAYCKKENKTFYWRVPTLPSSSLPVNEKLTELRVEVLNLIETMAAKEDVKILNTQEIVNSLSVAELNGFISKYKSGKKEDLDKIHIFLSKKAQFEEVV